MKFLALVATLASVALATDSVTTVTCPGCNTPTSTNDMVTRSDMPTSDCSAPPLTVVKTGDISSGGMMPIPTGSESGKPTSPPVTGAAGRIAGSALAAAVAAVALL
ncbi:hypothetical protein NLG97_g6595 [Lecanicillium saksenae]|uniref:Uncharacterized protein n=1 Tax=Lecanicillium saksenae TaxID=468837 RepID=A0ACC1QQU4_9HYPO|nr:hypothetical protein NLG97_g6595 [Lecanicillium saksenae]